MKCIESEIGVNILLINLHIFYLQIKVGLDDEDITTQGVSTFYDLLPEIKSD